MELLLNLLWLLLAMPAYYLWRNARSARNVRSFSSLQCLLALGCALVLLFPVISATDDLHAMRAEMEESGSSKRNIRQAGGEKSSTWHTRWHNPPAAVATFAAMLPFSQVRQALRSPALFYTATPPVLRAGRAPPAFTLLCNPLG